VCLFIVFSTLIINTCSSLPNSTTLVRNTPPTLRRTLVLLQHEAFRQSHSSFFQSLQDEGQQLTFRLANDPDVKLQQYGEYLFDSLIIFITNLDQFGGVDVDSILRFIDEGNGVLLVTDGEGAVNSEPLKELVAECGIDLPQDVSSDGNNVNQAFDHLNFDLSDLDGPHTLLAVSPDSSIPAVIVNNQRNSNEIQTNNSLAPVLFRGVGFTLKDSNRLIFPLLRGSSTSFTGPAESLVSSRPSAVGRNNVLVAALQARNSARFIFSGSLDLFSDKYFQSPVQRYSRDGNSQRFEKSGNEDFSLSVARWVLRERGVLRVTDPKQQKVPGSSSTKTAGYRITDLIDFSVHINEWNGKEWAGLSSKSVQMEFVRLDPYVRVFMTSVNEPGKFELRFNAPDVYGVFTLRVLHDKLGYSRITWEEIVPVRPFRHDEYERFIPAAFPYYASSFSMMGGFFLFSFFFLYHRSSSELHKKTE